MSDFTINNPYASTDDQQTQPSDDQFVRLDNANASDASIYDKLSDPRFDPESAKIAAEAAIGTLDDAVDITAPDYDEAKAESIESAL